MIENWPDLDEDKKLLIEQVRAFAQAEIAPKAAELDHTGRFPLEIVAKLGEMGLLGMMVPEKYGGSGMDAVSYAMCMEAVSEACASTGVIMSVNNSLVCYPISKYAPEALKARVLPELASGKKIGCFALSEPGHGSDPAGLKCAAKKVPGGYSVRGTKNWITSGKEAGYCVLFATLDPQQRHKSIICLLVDTKSKGFQVAKLEDKLGIKASSTAQLFFDDVFVPDENLIAPAGEAFKVAMNTLDGGRIGIASQALGISNCAFKASVKFANEREQFGAPIARLQAIQFFLADMATRLQGARLLTWFAAKKKDTGGGYAKEAAMAKLAASEASNWITDKAIQVHGGYGYTKEYVPERCFRDARITEIYEGTSEIQRIVIANQVLKEFQDHSA